MKYACLVYINPDNAPRFDDEVIEKTISDCGAWIGELERNNNHVFSAGLQAPSTAVTLRKRNGEITTTDGPFAETKEFLGGLTVLEARDLNDAIRQASRLAEVCGGAVEVRPEMDPFGELSDPMDRKFAEVLRRMIKQEAPL